MPLPKVQRNVQDQQGNIVPGVLGSVYNQGTGVLASLFSDDAGTVVLANPMTNDASYGSFKFYINPGHYDMTFTKPGYTFESIYDMQVPQDTLTLGTMSVQNANAVAITGGSIAGLTQLQSTRMAINTAIDASYQLAISGPVIQTGGSLQVVRLGINRIPAPDVQLHIDVLKNAGYGLVLKTADADAGANATALFVNLAGAIIGSITTTAAATAYNTTSDARLKRAVETLTGALERVRALRPVSYRWHVDDSPGVGFLAHEVQAIAPEAVTGEPDAVDEAGQIVPQQMDLSRLVPWLTAALQETLAQVDVLTARVQALEGMA
jgi:Chaperone of endosialidase